MEEQKFKQTLRDEIKYYRSHTVEEIYKEKGYIGAYKAEEMKKIYDQMSETDIEEYINSIWLRKILSKRINEKIEESEEVRIAVSNIEELGMSEENYKLFIKKQIKNLITKYGIIIFSMSCIGAILSLISQNPSIMALSSASGILLPIALFTSTEYKIRDIKNYKYYKESIEILKEVGIYDSLIEKINLDDSIEQIENKGKGM